MTTSVKNNETKPDKGASSNGLAITFLILLVVGAFGTLVNVLFAAGVMLLYLLIGLLMRRNQISIDQFADSLYYMGFLFTLWALLISIGPFSDDPKESLIENVGMALLTTLIGLGARVVIIQLRPVAADPVEIEQNIETATVKLVDQLKKSIDIIDGSAKQFSTDISKSKSNLTNQLSKLANKINNINIPTNVFEKSFDKAAKSIESSVEEMGNIIAESSEAIQKALGEIEDDILAATRTNTALTVAGEKLDELILKTNGYQEILASNTAELSSDMEAIRTAATGLTGTASRISASAIELTGELRIISKDFKNTCSDIDDINIAITEVAAAISKEINDNGG
jgi:uncharacterized membrane protein YciS (DUF1049 family)/prophage DNA circulation protein